MVIKLCRGTVNFSASRWVPIDLAGQCPWWYWVARSFIQRAFTLKGQSSSFWEQTLKMLLLSWRLLWRKYFGLSWCESRSLSVCVKRIERQTKRRERMNFFIYTLAARSENVFCPGRRAWNFALFYTAMESHRLYSHPHAGTFRGRVHAEHILKQCHACVCEKACLLLPRPAEGKQWRLKLKETLRVREHEKCFLPLCLSLCWCARLDSKTKAQRVLSPN